MMMHLAYSHPWATKKPRRHVASSGNRYESAPVGHVLRVAEMTEPSKAAGAIVSSFSSHDKLLVMAKGAKAVYAAVKAISSARFMALRGNVDASQTSFDIAMQPALQPGPQSMSELHQIRIYLFKVPVSEFSLMIGSGGQEKRGKSLRTMKVGALTDPRGLAGAITTTLLGAPGVECDCLAAGFVPVYRAIRGVAIARHVMLKKNNPHPDQHVRCGHEAHEAHDEGGSPTGNVSQEERKPKGKEDRDVKARLWPFPHQKRQRARVSAEDYGPRDREALDLMAFVGWRDFEDGRQCIALILKACTPGHLEGDDGMGVEDEDDLVAPRA